MTIAVILGKIIFMDFRIIENKLGVNDEKRQKQKRAVTGGRAVKTGLTGTGTTGFEKRTRND